MVLAPAAVGASGAATLKSEIAIVSKIRRTLFSFSETTLGTRPDPGGGGKRNEARLVCDYPFRVLRLLIQRGGAPTTKAVVTAVKE
jgi:hypothetical protein